MTNLHDRVRPTTHNGVWKGGQAMATATGEDLLFLVVTFLLAATVTLSVLVWGRTVSGHEESS